MLTRILILLASVLILYACEGKSEQQQDKSPIAHFIKPKDGKLSETQVVDYIAIRHQVIHEVKARNKSQMIALIEGADGSDQPAKYRYFDEIEKIAANDAGMSYDEYLWIKDTVISVQTALWLQHYYELNGKIVTLLDKTLLGYKENKISNLEKQEQKIMYSHVEEMKLELDSLRGKIQDQHNNTEAFIHNKTIISKYKNALEEVENQGD